MVGVDPGGSAFHAAVLRVERGEEHLDVHSVVVDQRLTMLRSGTLGVLHTKMIELMIGLESVGTDIAVFCEEPVVAGARNLQSSLKIAQTVGAIMAATTLYTPRCYLVPVSKWKKAVVGHGNASKSEVALWLNRVYPPYAACCGANQDLIDACCLVRYGLGVLDDAALVSTIGHAGQL